MKILSVCASDFSKAESFSLPRPGSYFFARFSKLSKCNQKNSTIFSSGSSSSSLKTPTHHSIDSTQMAPISVRNLHFWIIASKYIIKARLKLVASHFKMYRIQIERMASANNGPVQSPIWLVLIVLWGEHHNYFIFRFLGRITGFVGPLSSLLLYRTIDRNEPGLSMF